MLKLYGRDTCSNCQTTKKFLEARNIEYEWIDVDHETALIEWIRKNGYTPLPMIDVGAERWNGLNINKLNAYAQKVKDGS